MEALVAGEGHMVGFEKVEHVEAVQAVAACFGKDSCQVTMRR